LNTDKDRLKRFITALIPHGFIDHRRHQITLRRLGIANHRIKRRRQASEITSSVAECSFALWPFELRQAPYDWTLVDVGANIGGFCAAALSLVKPAELVAFEPQPSCQKLLRHAVKGHNNCRIIQAAVGNRCGIITLNCTRDSKFASVLTPLKDVQKHYITGSNEVEDRMEVPLVTLDGVLSSVDRIGLLKIDVQGFELEVLKGAVDVLQRTNAVLLEINYVPHYQNAVSFEDLFSFLQERNFTLRGVSAPFGDRYGAPLWADAIFCRKA
jgi:FkbM family methyltransferase